MDRRIITIIAVLSIGLTAFTIPLEDSDAEPTTTTMSNKYIFHTTIEWKDGYTPYNTGITFYFNEGSANHKAMEQYLEDRKTVITQDDKSNLSGTVHIYRTSTWNSDSIITVGVPDDDNIMLFGDEVMRPYNNTFFVKVGDTVTIRAYSATNSFGESCSAYVGNVNILSETYSETAKVSKEVSITFDNISVYNKVPTLFYNVTYEITGDSQPNGSANVFIVICTLVAVIGLGLLVVAAMKPKWSK